MHDDGTVVQQDPTGIGGTLFMVRQDTVLLQCFGYGINQGFNLPEAFPGTNNKVIGEAAYLPGIE
jgi:hypothetical protein